MPIMQLDGSGQAESYLGSLDVVTDASGEATFDVPYSPPAGKPIITATATDAQGNTSEISAARQATLTLPSKILPLVSDTTLTFSAASGDAISLDDQAAGPLGSLSLWDLSLSVAVGTLTLSSTAGLVGTGDGTGTLHYRGTIPALDAALDGLRYSRPAGYFGTDAVHVDAESNGSAGLRAQLPIGFFQVTTVADTGPGSLRQAIEDADAMTGLGTIEFAIPGDGVQTIAPASPLPSITAAVLIDGFSQQGYAGSPLIELSGVQAGDADGLTIIGSGDTIRGLAINGFAYGAAIVIDGPTANGDAIESNFIGTDATGLQSRPNLSGVEIADGAHDNAVGGTDPTAANLIADNGGSGVIVEGDSLGNRISGNRIFDNRQTGLNFDGMGGHVVVPDDPGLRFSATQSFTVTATVDIASLPNHWSGIVTKSRDLYPWYGLWISDTNHWEGGGPTNVDGSAVTLGLHSLAMVQDGSDGTRTLFVDGVVVALGDAQDGDGVGDLWIGGSNSVSENFDGRIDSVRIWSVALSADQIRAADEHCAPWVGSRSRGVVSVRRRRRCRRPRPERSPSRWHAGRERPSQPTWPDRDLAIDLGDDGVTANAPSPRQGPNSLQNYPVVVTTADGRLKGWLGGSLPESLYHIEFYASAGYASDGAGQAELYLGSLDLTTDSAGTATFDVPFTPPAEDPIVTATATDASTATRPSSRRFASRQLETPTQFVRVAPATPLVFSPAAGDAIALLDPDAGPLETVWDLEISSTFGAVNLSETEGLVGSGDGTDSLHYRGTILALDAALDGLRYDTPAGFSGQVTLSLAAQSGGSIPVEAQVVLTDGIFSVTTVADSGPGSLQQAILDADATPGQTTINICDPRQRCADDRPVVGVAGDHGFGADRWHVAARICGHAPDRAERAGDYRC